MTDENMDRSRLLYSCFILIIKEHFIDVLTIMIPSIGRNSQNSIILMELLRLLHLASRQNIEKSYYALDMGYIGYSYFFMY